MQSYLGNNFGLYYRHLATFYWAHCAAVTDQRMGRWGLVQQIRPKATRRCSDVRGLVVGGEQCDQMASLLFQYLAISNNETVQMHSKIAKDFLKFEII